jgi:uncharacterized membrane protein
MNAATLHLAVVHLTLPLLACGAVLVLGARLWHDERPFRLGLLFIVMAALAAALAYYTGPGADQLLTDLGIGDPGSREAVENHALWGRGLFVSLGLLGALALQSTLQYFQGETPRNWQRWTLLAGSITLLVLLAWTAHLGGQVRHTELGGTGRIPVIQSP